MLEDSLVTHDSHVPAASATSKSAITGSLQKVLKASARDAAIVNEDHGSLQRREVLTRTRHEKHSQGTECSTSSAQKFRPVCQEMCPK